MNKDKGKEGKDSLASKRKEVDAILDTFDERQLTEIVQILHKKSLQNNILKYSKDINVSDLSSEEFLFLSLVSKYNGNVIRKIFIDMGLSDYYFKKYIGEYNLDNIDRGVYLFPGSTIDAEFVVQNIYSTTVISHESALYKLGLTDVIPTKTIMSVSYNYNLAQIKKTSSYIFKEKVSEKIQGVALSYKNNDPILIVSSEAISKEDTQKGYTDLGNPIRVTKEERTIVDILKRGHHTEEEIKVEAIRRYLFKFPNNKTKLRRKAAEHHVLKELDKILLHYQYIMEGKI